MDPKRRREILLAIVVVVLAVAAYATYTTWQRPSVEATVASNEQARPARASRPAGSTGSPQAGSTSATQGRSTDAPQVHLGALAEDRPAPGAAGRDLFHFKVKPPPPPPPPPPRPVGPPLPPPPPGPPPVAPIGLKFIGIIDAQPPGKRLAVLSDGRGSPMYGHEGDTVLGQYRILRIGVESIEMSYLDGRGRQTIRLSGS